MHADIDTSSGSDAFIDSINEDTECQHVLSSLPSFASSLLAASEYITYGTNAYDVVTILIGTNSIYDASSIHHHHHYHHQA